MASAKFAIFGAGGVGGYFAGVLARAGFWTAVIARGEHLKAIQSHGLRIQSPKGDFTVAPAFATDNPQQVGPVDAVILAVKAWQVPEAARASAPLLKPGSKILPLENGVEAPGQLEEILGREHALIGLCRISSFVAGPGQIRHASLEPTILLGELDGSPLSPSAQLLANAFVAAGVGVETPKDMRVALWEKLIFIAALSGLGAVARATAGELRQCPPTRALLQQLMEEVAAVGRSRGVQLADDIVSRTLAFVDSIPVGATASMQRDIVDGKPSELEAIVGAVARFGDAANVPTPAMHHVYASLLPQEQRARHSVRPG
jgi:2-dehydropantoate 2-reductase